jgi:hypothetical protein
MDLRPKHLAEEVQKRDVGNKGSELAREQAIIIGTHQHYKGGIYLVLFECPHSETGETMVIRKHLWPFPYSIKAVPKEIFLNEVVPGLLRHRPIGDIEREYAEHELKKKYV